MSPEIEHVLRPLDPLTLVDVGASGGTPKIWRELAAYSAYVGFDPDAREIREDRASSFRRAVYINKAVAADPAAAPDGHVHFHLTRSPYCSSTLLPNKCVTESFLSADSFIVEGESTAPVTTIAQALASLGLSRVDWMKIDTQGTDLSVFMSLPDEMRHGLLAADLEPGLRGAYVGEELFGDLHRAMQAQGFWLSRLDVLGFPRMRKRTLEKLTLSYGLDEAAVARGVRKTPGWVECRYLRTLESLEARAAPRRDYLVLWTFALLDQQWGYCLDVATEFAARFGADELPSVLSAAPLARIRAAPSAAPRAARRPRALHQGFLAHLKRRVKSAMRHAGISGPRGHVDPDLDEEILRST